MSKKVILLTLILMLFVSPVHGFLGSLFKPAKESDMISYYAPCWGEDNKIYFIKKVTFGVAIHEKDAIGRLLLLGGDYFVKDVKYFLCSMNYDGTDKKEITELFTKKARRAYKKAYKRQLELEGVGESYLDYCSATKKLVYNIWNSGIWTINIDGSEEKCIASEGSHPSWSPDGKKIVYRMHIIKGEKGKDGFLKGPLEDYDSLWVMEADGSNKNKILSEEVDVWITSPIWSPKGDLIAFVCQGWICVMKPDGTERRRVKDSNYIFGWAPSGNLLLVSGCPEVINGEYVGGNWWIDLDGNIVKKINYGGLLSSDEKRYLAQRNFYVIDAKTGEEKDLFADVRKKDKKEYFVYKKPNNIW